MAFYKGTSGDDTFVGTALVDRIQGFLGRDRLSGGKGGDTIAGDSGADWLDGGAGDDVLFAGNLGVVPNVQNNGVGIRLDDQSDTDTLIGGDGNDTIFAGVGDMVAGGSGDADYLALGLQAATAGMTIDLTFLATGDTVMIGSTTLSGMECLLWLHATKFDDVIQGEGFFSSGYGVIDGAEGNDSIFVEGQADLHGGAGDDTIQSVNSGAAIYGDDGNDTLVSYNRAYGGDGNDTISSSDFASGGLGDDRLIGLEYFLGNVLWGNEGNDVIIGSDMGDEIAGGSGADTIYGGDGDDDISTSEPRADFLYPMPDIGAEHDYVKAGRGNDTVSIGYGDVADGGTGWDRLALSLVGATRGVVISAQSARAEAVKNGPGMFTGFEEIIFITGSAFRDTLSSMSGRIDGGSGNDRLSLTGEGDILGGDGDDTIMGGAGGSRYGGAGNDTIDFSALGAGVSLILAESSYGRASFKLDGRVMQNGLYEIENVVGTSQADSLSVAGKGVLSYRLQGGGGNDSLMTERAIAWLEGGDGDDMIRLSGERFEVGTISLSGGRGRDTLVIDTRSLAIDLTAVTIASDFEALNAENTDITIRSSQMKTIASVAARSLTLVDAGNVDFSTGTFTGTLYLSNGGNRAVLANTGSNSVFGGSAADTIIGGVGKDFVRGGDGNDTIDGGSTSPLNASGDLLFGNAGDDILIGGRGSDIIDGGTGVDRMSGSSGDDLYFVDTVGDSVSEAIDGGVDSVQSFVDFALGNNVENLTLLGSARSGRGNALDNVITGNNHSNYLVGGGGNDRLIGGFGSDTYVIDSKGDVIIDSSSEEIDAVFSFIDFVLVTGVENLSLLGEARIGTGNGLANRITGTTGRDTLHGLDGNDVINGGADIDTMVGGNGNDSYTIDNPGDQIVELAGGGNDAVTASADYILPEEIEDLRLVGSARAGTGNAGANLLVGGNGHDMLSALEGNDIIDGGLGNDVLIGGAGQDVLSGGAGLDTMSGGDGDDSYTVDNSGDQIVEVGGGGSDAVTATANYVLSEEIESLTLSGNARAGTGNAGVNLLQGSNGDDMLSALAGNDIINGGLGNDTLIGGAGQDVLFGNEGADRFVFRSGDSTASYLTADGIVDFAQPQGDRVDLSALGPLNFIGGGGFSGGSGQVRYEGFDGDTLVSIDINGDRQADMVIGFLGSLVFSSGDFILG